MFLLFLLGQREGAWNSLKGMLFRKSGNTGQVKFALEENMKAQYRLYSFFNFGLSG
jgi:hypothetical protein